MVERSVIPFDAAVVEAYLAGEYTPPDSLTVMETTAADLKAALKNKSVWINPMFPGCSNMFVENGIVDKLNRLADTSQTPVLILSIHYLTPLLEPVQDSLNFQPPFLVVSNAAYGEKNSLFKRNWQHLLEELIGEKYPKRCNQFLFRADGSCGCLTYEGEFREIH